MAVWNNCPACGCMVEATETRCPTCGTPIQKPRKTAQAVAIAPAIDLPANEDWLATIEELNCKMAAAVMTPNEARALMGLPPV